MEILVFLIITIVVVLIIRFFGAWMFRIDEIITNQKKTFDLMNRLNDNLEKSNSLANKNLKRTNDIAKNKVEMIRDLEEKLKNNEITPSQFQIAKNNILKL